MRGESNQEKEKQIMVKKKKLNGQEKEKEVEKEKENEKDEKNKNEERSKCTRLFIMGKNVITFFQILSNPLLSRLTTQTWAQYHFKSSKQ